MFRHVGFVLEGHLRGTHRKDGQWYDSSAMGLLAEEYTRRRARLVGSPAS
jgi:RimJ/RimL family protein N-acetyltransferase